MKYRGEKASNPQKTENLWTLKLTSKQNTPQIIHFSPGVKPFLFLDLLEVIKKPNSRT